VTDAFSFRDFTYCLYVLGCYSFYRLAYYIGGCQASDMTRWWTFTCTRLRNYSNAARLLASSMKFDTKRFLVSITEITISKHADLTTQSETVRRWTISSRLELLFRGGGLLVSADTSVRDAGYFYYRPDDLFDVEMSSGRIPFVRRGTTSEGGYYRTRHRPCGMTLCPLKSQVHSGVGSVLVCGIDVIEGCIVRW